MVVGSQRMLRCCGCDQVCVWSDHLFFGTGDYTAGCAGSGNGDVRFQEEQGS